MVAQKKMAESQKVFLDSNKAVLDRDKAFLNSNQEMMKTIKAQGEETKALKATLQESSRCSS